MRFRYPGPESFADAPFDSRMFFGRREEEVDLANHVAGVRLVILYGKSGLGKTSLLQAGLFPGLRKLNFFPIRVRPAEIEGTLTECVSRQLVKIGAKYGYQVTLSPDSELSDFFTNTAISKGERFQIPVLVFDQFEEVFNRMDRDSRRALIAEIQALLFPPAGKGPTPDIRVVLSLREEYVGALDEFSNMLPGVLAHRYRLRPLSRDKAEEAISKPAGIEEEGEASPTFTFSNTAVSEMLDYLEDSNHDVEPIELQILCQHIEREVVRRYERGRDVPPVTVDEYFPDGMQAALGNYYLNIVNEFSGVTRRRVRRFCEQGLVTLDGYRDSIRKRRIRKLYGLNDSILDDLVDKRLLRREDRLNDVWYELTHDRLAEAVAASRPEAMLSALVVRGRWLVDGLLVATACTFVFAGYSFALSQQRAPVLLEISGLGRNLPPLVEFSVAASPIAGDLRGTLADLEAQGLIEFGADDFSIRIQSDNLFASGSTVVAPNSVPVLAKIGNALNQLEGSVLVMAHSDNVPITSLAFGTNLELTQARAEAVSAALIQAGVQADRIIAEGRGETEPLIANDSAQGRATNRRVEIQLVPPGMRR